MSRRRHGVQKMDIYIDESVHEKLGFMLLAFVLCPTDPHSELADIMAKHEKHEFHASENMDGNKLAQELRAEMKQYVNWNCGWGVFVLPSDARWKLADELSGLIKDLVRSCAQPDSVRIFLDDGIINPNELETVINKSGVKQIILSKSHEIYGIQLADLVASLSGVRLREEISRSPKMLTYGDEAGFNPPIEAELGYELWADLRYSMRRSSEPLGEGMIEMAEFSTSGYGLFISEKCSPELRTSAEKIFGRVYLGCIH